MIGLEARVNIGVKTLTSRGRYPSYVWCTVSMYGGEVQSDQPYRNPDAFRMALWDTIDMELSEDSVGRGAGEQRTRDKEVLHCGPSSEVIAAFFSHPRYILQNDGEGLYKRLHLHYYIRILLDWERSDAEENIKFYGDSTPFEWTGDSRRPSSD